VRSASPEGEDCGEEKGGRTWGQSILLTLKDTKLELPGQQVPKPELGNQGEFGKRMSFKGFQDGQWTWEFQILPPNIITIYTENKNAQPAKSLRTSLQ
jgi:hypothetical protein